MFQQMMDFCANASAQKEKMLCSLFNSDLGVFTKGTVQGKGKKKKSFFLKLSQAVI